MSRSKDPLIGATLGGYRVHSCLSRGSLFNVYIAHQSSVDRTVVLKILAPSARVEKPLIAAFLDGARQAARLNHRNIVQVFNVVEEDGLTFVSMELVGGGSVTEIVARKGALSRELWPKLIVDSCAALAHAEEAGIVHAELTPSNVLVTGDGDVKILNLGIAAAIEPFRPPMKKREPRTVAFLAPEQIVSGASSHSADVYALGSSLYLATTGRPPYRADSVAELVVARQSRKVPPLSQLDPSAPEEVSSLLTRFMEPHAKDRPANPREALAEARSSIATESPWRKHGLKLAVAAALLVVLSIMAISSGQFSPADDAVTPSNEIVASTKTSTGETPRERRTDKKLLDDIASTAMRTHAEKPTEKDGVSSASTSLSKRKDPVPNPADDEASEELKIALDNQVTPSIEIGSYRQGLEYIRKLSEEYPNAELLDEAIAKITRAAEAEIATTKAKVETTTSIVEIFELIQVLKSLESRVPEDLVATVSPIRRAAITRHETALAYKNRLEDAETSVLFILGEHDVDAAREVIARLPESPFSSLRAERERVAKRIDLYQLSWNVLLSGLAKAKDDTSVQLVAPTLDPSDESLFRSLVEVKVDATEAGRVELKLRAGQSSKPRECQMLDLHPISLLALLRLGEAGETSEAVKGLETILFSRRGPLAALRFVDILPLSDESRKSTTENVTRLGNRLLTGSVENLQSLATLEADNDAAKAAGLVALREAVDELIARHGALPYYKQHRPALSELRIRAVESIYTRRGPASLFHGTLREKKKGLVQLDYDFSSADAMKDFVLVSGTMRHESRALTLSGECRMLLGNPFRTRIRITAHVVEYTPSSPNLNIAIWTRPEDRITSVKPEVDDVEPDKEKYGPTEGGTNLQNDYVAFCIGYRLDGETLNQVGTAKAVATMPAFAIVSGIRGITLHRGHGDGAYYTYWAESVGNRLKGAQTIVIDLAPDAFRWTTGAMRLHTQMRKKRPDAMRWLRRTQALGSVTLFTNGQLVRYGKLRIETELDPAWISAERTRRAQLEFDAVESRYGAAK
jgi:serine/threonine protein kinase/uncharacterized protein with HEPN domain